MKCSATSTVSLKSAPRLQGLAPLDRGTRAVRKANVICKSAVEEAAPDVSDLKEQVKAEATRPVDDILDEQAILAKSTFPIKPAKLIELSKAAVSDTDTNFVTNPDIVDPDAFVFKAPFVGPLSYSELQEALGNFEFKKAFPGSFQCLHNFWVDPCEPCRVWYTYRFYGKNTGPILGQPPTNITVDVTPCMHSLVFNEQGKIIKATVGYPMDRDIGNTGGLGGIFGPLYAIGRPLPIPECLPYKPSWQFRFFNLINTIRTMLRK